MQKTIREILKLRLIDQIFSRKFIALLVAAAAFFLTDKFSDTNLMIAIGIYTGFNTLESILPGVGKGKGNGDS